MEKIFIDETKGEEVTDGFKKIIQARLEGKEAKWEFGGFVTTTDMVPDRFMSMSFDEILHETKRTAIKTKIDLIQSKTGKNYIDSNMTEEQYYSMFEEYEQEMAQSKSNTM